MCWHSYIDKIGKALVARDFNVRVGTYQNVEVDNNVMVSNSLCAQEDYIM